MTTRRNLVMGFAATAGVSLVGGHARARDGLPQRLDATLARIADQSGGRLGVAVLDTASGARAGHRAAERFPMCSTFKLLAAAAVLHRVDPGAEQLERRVAVAPGDIVTPTTRLTRPVPGGITMAALCETAMIDSDNTAANLILASLGGPEGLTAFLRAIGDGVTRLDRVEPALNDATPGDPRDTTTPEAMVQTMHRLLLGDALSPASRQQLTQWLIDNKTGDARLRAGLPAGWRAGDKTGSGGRGTTNDVGIVWPPQRGPILVAVYLTETTAPAHRRNASLAAVGQALAAG